MYRNSRNSTPLSVALNLAFVLVQLEEQELEIAPQQDHLFFSFEEFINEFFFNHFT